MSNKSLDKLNPLDQKLRVLFPVETTNEREKTQLTIKKICGFELFNTRPYHNYETFSDGYVAIVNDVVVCKAEDLDDLINMLVDYKCQKCKNYHHYRRECTYDARSNKL